VHSATLGLLPAPLRRWRQAHPGVQLGLHEYGHSDELTTAMRNGEADVAIGPTPDDWSGDLLSLGDEELLIVLAHDDPLAGWQGPLELTFLADRGWVHFVPEHGLAELLDKACAEAGFSPKIALRAEQTARVPLLAAAGLGPTRVPASIISVGFDGLTFETSPPTRRPLAGYHRLNADPLTVEFSRSIAAEVELMPPHVAMRLRLMEQTRPTTSPWTSPASARQVLVPRVTWLAGRASLDLATLGLTVSAGRFQGASVLIKTPRELHICSRRSSGFACSCREL
jgi:hypothetical protein